MTTRRERVAFALLMGVITTGIISFGLVSLNVGFTTRLPLAWVRSWALAYVIVVPLILLVAPRLRALVTARVGGPPESKRQKIAFALSMGVVTTGVISFALVYVNLSADGALARAWIRAWGLAYAAVVPALLCVAPRVERFVQRLLGVPPAAAQTINTEG